MSSSILLDYSYVTPGRMVAACVLFPLLTIIIVVLRFSSRLSHKSPLKSDDWLILISTVVLALHTFHSVFPLTPARLSMWDWALRFLPVSAGNSSFIESQLTLDRRCPTCSRIPSAGTNNQSPGGLLSTSVCADFTGEDSGASRP